MCKLPRQHAGVYPSIKSLSSTYNMVNFRYNGCFQRYGKGPPIKSQIYNRDARKSSANTRLALYNTKNSFAFYSDGLTEFQCNMLSKVFIATADSVHS